MLRTEILPRERTLGDDEALVRSLGYFERFHVCFSNVSNVDKVEGWGDCCLFVDGADDIVEKARAGEV